MGFTNEQYAAINARGKVLVSASAGAGKTTVMIKRLADILQGGASLDNVLAVTFTKKAAAQMKEKLRLELVSRLSESDEKQRENIRVQLGKINSADISTIHSFCARLVRTYFYALDDVDASFEIAADEAVVAEMQARAMDNLFDGLYGKNGSESDKNFLFLVDRLKKKRSDASVREALTDAYKRLRIEPEYGSVAQRTEEVFSDGGFDEVCARLGEIIGERCAFYAKKVEEFGATLSFASGGEAYAAFLNEIYENLKYAAVKKDIFDRPQKLTNSSKPRVKAENKEEDARLACFVNGLKKRYESLFRDVKSREEEKTAFDESGRLARAFVSTLLQFDAEYSAVKREEGKLDYGDLEHLAYSLVCASGGDKDVKEQIKSKYKYVFVDEYQDVNPIQDAIINAVGSEDVFKVGDVKQAIYGFRGSRSHFFAAQLKEAAERGNCVVLPHNFRSSGAVVGLVNDLFSRVMTPVLCGFDYVGDNHAMISGNEKSAGRGVAELCTFERAEKNKTVADGVYSIVDELPMNSPPEAESLAVVNLIDELLQSEIYDEEIGGNRKIQQGDICVLSRKKNKKSVVEIERALLAKGYRVDGAAEENVCDRADIKRLLNILSYIDNAEQDVALVASLLSPLGDLSEDELAEIRLFGGTGKDAPPFRRCAEKYAAEKGDALAGKLNAFFERTARLKRLSEGVGAARLIDEITGCGGFVAVYAEENRLSALRRLQKEAYSAAGELSLNAFLAKLKSAEYKVKSPLPPSSDSIKIMTMHASKGLEFPVVIITDIAASFGGDDKTEMPYDETFGFAPKYYDEKKRTYGGTLLRKLCRLCADTEELKNEINLFYVACTRAKNNLYILCGKDGDFDEAGVLTASCYADLFDKKSLKNIVIRPICADERAENELKDGGMKALGDFAVDEELYEKLKKTFDKPIGGTGVQLPVKSSATKLLQLSAEEDIYPVLFNEDDGARGGTGVDSGIAYHRFLQLCDFSIKSEEGVKAQIASWLDGGLITAEQAGLLDVSQLKKILAMPQFASLENAATFREREFLCALTAKEYSSIAGGSFAKSKDNLQADAEGATVGSVVIQGAIDFLAVRKKDGRAVGADVIDYKYSALSDETLRNKYRAQLALYKTAVMRIYGLPEGSVSTTIINIRACSAIAVEV